MDNQTRVVTREQVIELAKTMASEKLAVWYEYGLFVQSHPVLIPEPQTLTDDELQLQAELQAWEAASDEDWLTFEQSLEK